MGEAPISLPPIRRLRVCLLGGDTVLTGIGKADVAAALLRGFTADTPGASDPVLDFAFDKGVFERAWRELLLQPPPGEPGSEGWGTGQLPEWGREGRVQFDRRGPGEATPAYDAAPDDTSASLCPGNAEKLGLGQGRSIGPSRPFREALVAAGLDTSIFEELHREVSTIAEAQPRQLVRRDRPRPGVLASFARSSPEVGDLAGCSSAFLHVFELPHRPASEKNVAMVYAAAPNGRTHKGLTSDDFMCAMRSIGSNIGRMMRQYNRLALSHPLPGEAERTSWWFSDLRAQVEYYLSDRNLKLGGMLPGGEQSFRDAIGALPYGWLDMAKVRGPAILASGASAQDLVDALSSSRCVQLKVDAEGRALVRRTGKHPDPPTAEELRRKMQADAERAEAEEQERKRRREVEAEGQRMFKGPREERAEDTDGLCWDWAKGFCPRGDDCKYCHVLPPSAQMNMAAQGNMGAGRGLFLGVGPPPFPVGRPNVPMNTPAFCGGFSGGNQCAGGFGGGAWRPPPAPAPTQAAPTGFAPGVKVQIHGLVMKAKYNDCVAECESYDAEASRWNVRMGDGSSISVKATNLLLLPS